MILPYRKRRKNLVRAFMQMEEFEVSKDEEVTYSETFVTLKGKSLLLTSKSRTCQIMNIL
jgi:hypothetical protein